MIKSAVFIDGGCDQTQAALPDEVYFKLRWIQSEVSEIFYSVHITVLGQRIELEL